MKIEPRDDRVLIRPEPEERVLSSGLVVPSIERDRRTVGEVVAVGPGKVVDAWPVGEYGPDMPIHFSRAPMDVEVGDRVICREYSGAEVIVDDERMFLVHQEEILCVVSRDAAVMTSIVYG